MKIEIDLPDDEIRNAVTNYVFKAVREKAASFDTRDYIKAQINNAWNRVVEPIIADELSKCDDIRANIAEQLERKIRAQLTLALKAASQ